MTTHFVATDDELASGALELETLDAIRASISEQGYAVVANLISDETCELLMGSVLEDAAIVRAQAKKTAHEDRTGKGHLQLGLRRYAPYVTADLVANPLIEHVVSAVLGKGAWLGFYNGNVNLPGSEHQPLHYDRPYSWASKAAAEADGQPWPPPTTTLSCSVGLTEITEENGATEIYPRSHLETAVADWPLGTRPGKYPELLEKWGPPGRMAIPRGGVCFRDPRMWHRGVPNPSDEVRPMIAITYHAGRCLSWRGRLLHDISQEQLERCTQDPSLKVLDDGTIDDGRLVFDADVRAVFDGAPNLHGVNRNVRFIEAPLKVNHFIDAHLIGGARVIEGEVQAVPS